MEVSLRGCSFCLRECVPMRACETIQTREIASQRGSRFLVPNITWHVRAHAEDDCNLQDHGHDDAANLTKAMAPFYVTVHFASRHNR